MTWPRGPDQSYWACLVALMKADHAPQMQGSAVWMAVFSSEPCPTHATRHLESGSRATDLESVSPGLGCRGRSARMRVRGRMHEAPKKEAN